MTQLVLPETEDCGPKIETTLSVDSFSLKFGDIISNDGFFFGPDRLSRPPVNRPLSLIRLPNSMLNILLRLVCFWSSKIAMIFLLVLPGILTSIFDKGFMYSSYILLDF